MKTVGHLTKASTNDPNDHIAIVAQGATFDIRIESNNAYVCLIPNRQQWWDEPCRRDVTISKANKRWSIMRWTVIEENLLGWTI